MPRLRRARALVLLVVLATVAACTGGDVGTDRSADATTTTTTSPATTGATAPGEEPTDEPSGGVDVLHVGLVGITTLDPLGASPASVSDVVLADLLHDTLTTVDDDGVAQPGLATFFSDESRTLWRFELGDDAMFADDTPITADDVVFSLQRVRSRGASSLAALQLEEVESIEVVDAGTVDITLRSPSSLLPEQLSAPAYGIVDREQTEAAAATGVASVLASGDYRAAITSATRLRLDRRRGSGPAVVEVELLADEAAATEAFLSGRLDWAPLPLDALGEELAAVGTASLDPFHGMVLLGVNPTRPPLDEPRLRQAIALSIDRVPLVDAVFGLGAQPALGLIPAGVPGAAAECRDPCGPDVETAQLLSAAAFPSGQDVPIRLLTDTSEIQAAIAGVLEEQLAAGGIDLVTSALEITTFDQIVSGGQQQLFLYSTLGVSRSPVGYLETFATTSPDNLAGGGNELLDLAIAEAAAEPDPTLRRQRWQEVEATILAGGTLVPLAQLRTVSATAPGVSGIVVRADGSLDLSGVTFGGSDGG